MTTFEKLMEAIIKRITPCEHDWEDLGDVKTYDSHSFNKRPIKIRRTWSCKKCKKSKSVSR